MSETPLSARELVDSVLTGVVRTGYDGPDGISKDEALERSCILAARVEAVLALHVAAGIPEPFVPGPRYCKGCGCAWPCPTRRALEGEP